MRKIKSAQIVVFLVLFLIVVVLAIVTTALLLGQISLGEFKGVLTIMVGGVFIYLFSFCVYRIYLYFMPIKPGYIAEGSREEFAYHVHLLFYFFLFYPLTRTHFLPVPLMRLIYIALGASLGNNTYSAGTVLDPLLLRVGSNTLIGHDALLFSHAVEGKKLSLYPIEIGNRVTIGAKAVIMPGVTIGDDAIVAVSAVVTKGTRIGNGELWGGIPARPMNPEQYPRSLS